MSSEFCPICGAKLSHGCCNPGLGYKHWYCDECEEYVLEEEMVKDEKTGVYHWPLNKVA